jgi:hypothetical protein
MAKYKSAREILLDMFTEPNNKNISLVLVLTATAFLYASIMEAIEFCFTHVFMLGEYLKEITVLLAPIMTIYTGEKLGMKFMEHNKPDTSEKTDSDKS